MKQLRDLTLETIICIFAAVGLFAVSYSVAIYFTLLDLPDWACR